ncbi:TetR/AcrR family transcriptional regulator [Streptomyces sp. NPDC059740]|uniref:TetR/AcrR family transcriptional regulator n=1 Tax=Streptomyces sp. NPDC059740 TaxID=3346926 RepID=UPI0036593855
MTTAASIRRPPRGGREEKRLAIARAARTVFGREGYTRASVDAIAAEAGVSKRTVYNHHRDKKELFLAVLEESTQAVADYQAALLEKNLGTIGSLEDGLTALGRDLAAPPRAFSGHFALVRVLIAEAPHLPREVLEGWRANGPRRTSALLARRLGELADEGLLKLDDPATAAARFAQLVTSDVFENSFHGAVPIPDAEIERIVTSGVRAFLELYGPGTRP